MEVGNLTDRVDLSHGSQCSGEFFDVDPVNLKTICSLKFLLLVGQYVLYVIMLRLFVFVAQKVVSNI